MGDAARDVAVARPRGRRRSDPARGRGGARAGRRCADAVCVLQRQLASAEDRSLCADGAAAILSRQRGRGAGPQRRSSHRDRTPRSHSRRHRPCHHPRGSGYRRRRCAASAHRDRLLGPRRHPQRRNARGRHCRSHPREARRTHHRREKPSRRRPHHPHQRRKAVVGLSALGRRLRRAALHRTDVAGIRGAAILPKPSARSIAASAASAACRRSRRKRCRASSTSPKYTARRSRCHQRGPSAASACARLRESPRMPLRGIAEAAACESNA